MLLLELLDLSGDFGIVAVGKHVPELGAALGRALDLGSISMEVSSCSLKTI